MRWLGVVVAFIVIMLASSNLPSSAQGVSNAPGRIEELLGLAIDAEGITFQVMTGGCTRPENFRLERFGKDPTQLLLIRTIPDPCDAFVSYGMKFTLSYSQLRLMEFDTFVVINPLARAQFINVR